MNKLSFLILLGLFGCASNSEETNSTQELDENSSDSINELLSTGVDTVKNVMEDFIEFPGQDQIKRDGVWGKSQVSQ